MLGSTAGMMISPAALKDGATGGALQAIGTGPFKLKSFEAIVRTILSRNDNSWGGIAGRAAGFEHHYVSDGRAWASAGWRFSSVVVGVRDCIKDTVKTKNPDWPGCQGDNR